MSQSPYIGVDPNAKRKADVDSPVFTGEPKAPKAPVGDVSDKLANTEFVAEATAQLAPLNSPELIGQPKAPTPIAGDVSDRIATTEFVAGVVGAVRKPSITSPAKGAVGVSITPTIQASAYYSLYGVAHSASQFQVSKQQDFAAQIVVDSGLLGAVTSYAVTSGMTSNTPYFARARYRDAEGTWSAWSSVVSFSTGSVIVTKPSITAPTNGATNIGETPTITTSAFAVTGGSDTHQSSDWQIWTGANGTGTKVWESLADTANKTSIAVTAGVLQAKTTYYARARHNGTSSGASSWSNDAAFTTAVSVNQPSISAPTNGATNIGGTPTITTSAFAVTGGSDTHQSSDWQIWTGANGTGTKVWESLADTANKTSKVVPSATLAVNTTYHVRARHNGLAGGASAWSPSVSFTTAAQFIPTTPGEAFGGGYYAGKIVVGADTYMLIVAPKSVETVLTYKTAASADSGVQSKNDGLANSNALNNASHPAAQYCRGLTTGGYTDWYLPARDELEILYRSFKPTTGANTTGVRIESGSHGENANSLPVGAAYTAGNPAQTSIAAFKSGGAEGFASSYYWSSTEYAPKSADAWLHYFGDGNQLNNVKDFSRSVRPVRRIKI